MRSPFTVAWAIVAAAACGGTPRHGSDVGKPAPVQAKPAQQGKLTTDPDLNQPAKKPLLAIDWSKVSVQSKADALALWKQIAPTGDDYEAKLAELPDDGPIPSALAVALLDGGNFTCVKPVAPSPNGCTRTPVDIEDPAPTTTFDDPCLRRKLALWAIEALDDDDLPAVHDALRAIAALPPPESELVAAALGAYPEDAQDDLVELRGIAFAAGQREIVNGKLSPIDPPHLTTLVQKHHVDGALEILSAEANRPVYMSAVNDELLAGKARAYAINELAATVQSSVLPADMKAAFVKASKAKDCSVAAAAARQLVKHGQRAFAPLPPRGANPAATMRGLCVVASYEALQQPDEASFLLAYVPPKGFELAKVAYDPYNETDEDGDGDPHTVRTSLQIGRDEATLPELDDLIRAFSTCDGTVCKSEDHEFRFSFKAAGSGLAISKIEVIERPPCTH